MVWRGGRGGAYWALISAIDLNVLSALLWREAACSSSLRASSEASCACSSSTFAAIPSTPDDR